MTAKKERAAKAVADVTEGRVLASVDIASTPARIFRALTTEEVARWWGSPDTYQTTSWSAELRVGGRWRSDGIGRDGSPFFVSGEYLEIDPPQKLVHTWEPGWEPGTSTRVTYLLAAIDGGTRVTVKHEGFGDRIESCRGHAEGWERVLGWLGAHLLEPAPPAHHFLCRLLGPRPTFPADMTPDEARVMQEHLAYWNGHLNTGSAIVFGPVLDPGGVWGLGVVRAADQAAVEALQAGDPVITSGLGFRYQTLPMLNAIYRS